MRRTLAILLFSCHLVLAGTNGLYSDAQSWTGSVYISIIGDSIPAGGSGPGSQGILALPTNITFASSGLLSATNFSVGGSHWTNQPWFSNDIQYSMEGQITQALAVHPRWLFIDCGANDVYPYINTSSNLTAGWPSYWPTISNAISWIYFKCQSNNTKLLLGDVLPYNGDTTTNYQPFADSTTRTNYNAQYRLFCANNPISSYLCAEFYQFAITNTATGFKDLLNPIYSLDGLHLNSNAFPFWGTLIVSNLAQFFADPSIATAATLHAGTLRSPP